MSKYNVGAYIRLSRDESYSDSDSIDNQIKLADYYCENNDLEIIEKYIDNGYSGTTFDRPGFQNILRDIECGLINTVIVKDLSRLGRNYIQVGYYLHYYFPDRNIRFISINDDFDSLKHDNIMERLDVPLKNMMYDHMAYETSVKVKKSLRINKENGNFVGSSVIYGYLKNPKDKHKFIIDKEASYIVKKIFNMILLGKSRKEIAEHLNNKNVLTPSLYKLSNEIPNNEELICSKKWNAEIVNRILRNETYTGTLIQNIKTKSNYRTDKLIDVNKDEWIITENHHEPIISKDKFDEVQQILNRKTKVNKNDDIDLFSGYLKCSHCGSGLVIKKSKNQIYYYCSSYIKDKSCLKYSINKKKLEQIVKDEIIKKINIEQLDRKTLNELIEMIYVIDKNNIKIEFKNDYERFQYE